MSVLTELFAAERAALKNTADHEPFRTLREQLQRAFKIAELYRSRPAEQVTAQDKRVVRDLSFALKTTLIHFTQNYPLEKSGRINMADLLKDMENPLFGRAQKHEMRRVFRAKINGFFEKHPEKAFTDLLGDRGLDAETLYGKLLLGNAMRHIEHVGAKDPVLAIQTAFRLLGDVEEGSRKEARLLGLINRLAPKYNARYEEGDEGFADTITVALLYAEKPAHFAAAKNVWHHYMINLTKNLARKKPWRGDPPGVLTMPDVSRFYRLQVYTAIRELSSGGSHDRKPHALAVARESLTDTFDYLASVDPKGLTTFATDVVQRMDWVLNDRRDQELREEVRRYTDAVCAKFMSSGLAESHPEHGHGYGPLPLWVANTTADPETRCLGLEAALRVARKEHADTGNFMDSARYFVSIARHVHEQDNPEERERHRNLPPEVAEQPAHTARREAVKAEALALALQCIKQAGPSDPSTGAKLATRVAKLAKRSSPTQAEGLNEALKLCEKLGETDQLKARERLHELAEVAAPLRRTKVLAAASTRRQDLSVPRPISSSERRAVRDMRCQIDT